MPTNEELACGLREKACGLPDRSSFRIALLAAANSIASHGETITSVTQAMSVKKVGPKVVEVLRELGLLTAAKRERAFIEGAQAASPTKQKRQRTVSSHNSLHGNVLIAEALRNEARDIDGSYGIALNSAARNIGNHPKELMDVRACMEVNGVGAQLAEKIVTEILKKELTEDERLYLAGARVKQS